MRWDDDGWPVIGDHGTPVTVHAKPIDGEKPAAPATSDDFAHGIGPQWAWQANPEPEWAAIDQGLRLACVPADTLDLRHLPNLLGQRLQPRTRTETTLRLHDAADGATAGLAVVGDDYAWIGLARTDGKTVITCRTAEAGKPAQSNGCERPVATGADTSVRVGVDVDPTGRCQFHAALPGEDPAPIGELFQAVEGRWVGAALGLFAAGDRGTAVFDAVHVTDAHG